MGGDSEYEPWDSRNITDNRQKRARAGEGEPRDSRNVTAPTPDGRWTNRAGLPPLADGSREGDEDEDEDEDEEDEDDEIVDFEPDPELNRRIRQGLHH